MTEVALRALEELAAAGIVVTLAYGPCGDRRPIWSVDCMTPNLESFDRPYAARDLEHAVEVAATECRKRGWVP